MESVLKTKKKRPEIRSLCLEKDIWEKAKSLAQAEGRSVSGFLRAIIRQLSDKKNLLHK